ncbi:ROK family transcriptional regulator [Microbispora sp. H11081]|uniref:ROK family transcriptional regulator n=1 Tax=Microbispora sp. H11081 TaxID=2729107 RepID=UPI0014743562|nr:ROK family transcriptional regulator [Microbispora sp. H11081]
METSVPGRAETRLQAKILTRLRDAGPQSRIQLSEHFEVSRTTIGTELGRLTALHLVEEIGPAASRGGRRSTVIDLAGHVRFVGIAIGATSVSSAVTDGRLRVLAFERTECDVRRGPEPVLELAAEQGRRLLVKLGVDRPLGVGVSVPGPVDFSRGIPVSPPIMPGWDGYPVRDVLGRRFDCPVLLDNDVNAMALGEQHTGVAGTVENFLFVKVGTGIGCGIVAKSELYRGMDGCAGDIGHIPVADSDAICVCGNTGCLEASFGGGALARDALAAARSGRSPMLGELLERNGTLTAADVGEAVGAGDPVSVQLVRDGGRRVGEVLAGLVSFFNPSLIVLGGGLTLLGHILLAEIRGTIYRRSLPLATRNLPIVMSDLGARAGVIGAARLVSQEAYEVSR